MKRQQIPQKRVYEKFYVHEIAAVNLSKIYFLKNAKKTCKPNNRDLNRDWIIQTSKKVKPCTKISKFSSQLFFPFSTVNFDEGFSSFRSSLKISILAFCEYKTKLAFSQCKKCKGNNLGNKMFLLNNQH